MIARLVRLGRAGRAREAHPVRDRRRSAEERRHAGAFRVLIPQLAPADLVRWREDASREPPVARRCTRALGVRATARSTARCSIPLGELARRLAELPRERAARHGVPHRPAQPARGDAPRAGRVRGRAQPRGRRREVGGRGRSCDEALLTTRNADAPGRNQRARRRARRWNADNEPIPRFRHAAALGLAALAGPAAGEDLLQIYREAQLNDPDDRGREVRMGSDAGEAAAGARRVCCRTASLFGNANYNNYDATIKIGPAVRLQPATSASRAATVSASQPLYRMQNSVAVRPGAGLRSRRPTTRFRVAQQDLILRVAVAYFDVLLAQFNIELTDAPEGRGLRTARAGEAQFRSRRRDDHRHQRSAGEVRLDRRAGNHDAERLRQQRHCAARDHRPVSEGPEAGRQGIPAAAARAQPRSSSGSTRRSRKT